MIDPTILDYSVKICKAAQLPHLSMTVPQELLPRYWHSKTIWQNTVFSLELGVLKTIKAPEKGPTTVKTSNLMSLYGPGNINLLLDMTYSLKSPINQSMTYR